MPPGKGILYAVGFLKLSYAFPNCLKWYFVFDSQFPDCQHLHEIQEGNDLLVSFRLVM